MRRRSRKIYAFELIPFVLGLAAFVLEQLVSLCLGWLHLCLSNEVEQAFMPGIYAC
jgi:hypothetical protein